MWGVLLALAFKDISVKNAALYSLAFFVLIEVIQFVVAAGAFDIDTIIQHFVGAIAGAAVALKILSKKDQGKAEA